MKGCRSIVVLVLVAGIGASSGAKADIVDDWDVEADNAAIRSGLHSSATFLLSAMTSLAVYDAAMAIDGRYEPYSTNPTVRDGASLAAAVATAAHDMLVAVYPSQQALLDAAYEASLATIPDRQSKADGISVGSQVAAELVAQRQNDGRFVVLPTDYEPLPFGPGVWLPSSGIGTNPWVRHVTPFAMDRVEDFLLDGPPLLSSDEWAADFDEVKAFGGLDSPVRTDEQLQLGLFMQDSPVRLFHPVPRRLAQSAGVGIVDKIRLYALFHTSLADAAIACWDNKFTFQFWRPEPAIRGPLDDGNPLTEIDPTWRVAFGATPNHPDYPSAHACSTGAFAQVLRSFFGRDRLTFIMTSATPGAVLDPACRSYERLRDVEEDMIDARIYIGFHFRTANEDGVKLGRKVAKHIERRFFRPTGSRGHRHPHIHGSGAADAEQCD
jgi:hypothetical protein